MKSRIHLLIGVVAVIGILTTFASFLSARGGSSGGGSSGGGGANASRSNTGSNSFRPAAGSNLRSGNSAGFGASNNFRPANTGNSGRSNLGASNPFGTIAGSSSIRSTGAGNASTFGNSVRTQSFGNTTRPTNLGAPPGAGSAGNNSVRSGSLLGAGNAAGNAAGNRPALGGNSNVNTNVLRDRAAAAAGARAGSGAGNSTGVLGGQTGSRIAPKPTGGPVTNNLAGGGVIRNNGQNSNLNKPSGGGTGNTGKITGPNIGKAHGLAKPPVPNNRPGPNGGPLKFVAGDNRNNNPNIGIFIGGFGGGGFEGGGFDGGGFAGGGGYAPVPGGFIDDDQPMVFAPNQPAYVIPPGSVAPPTLAGGGSANNNPVPIDSGARPIVGGDSKNANPFAPQGNGVARLIGTPSGADSVTTGDDPAITADQLSSPVVPVSQRIYNRRFLLLQNQTGQPIKIFLRYRNVNAQGQWEWVPGEEGELIYALNPGEERYVGHKNFRILADRVLIWARGENAEHYETYRFRELILGRPTERDVNGDLQYRGTRFGTFTYRFK